MKTTTNAIFYQPEHCSVCGKDGAEKIAFKADITLPDGTKQDMDMESWAHLDCLNKPPENRIERVLVPSCWPA